MSNATGTQHPTSVTSSNQLADKKRSSDDIIDTSYLAKIEPKGKTFSPTYGNSPKATPSNERTTKRLRLNIDSNIATSGVAELQAEDRDIRSVEINSEHEVEDALLQKPMRISKGKKTSRATRAPPKACSKTKPHHVLLHADNDVDMDDAPSRLSQVTRPPPGKIANTSVQTID
jgi:hypothetical protein